MTPKSNMLALAAILPVVGLTAGCTDLLANFFEERAGNVTIVIVNNTDYRASFTLGSYDAYNLNPPGSVDMAQHRYEAHTTNTFTVTCARNVAIGTQNLVDRAIATGEDQASGFDADAFGTVVNFSSAASDSDAAALPTEGTAAGLEVLLGVDYACNDELIFTFVQDATAAGGFRINYQLVHTPEDN